MRRAVAPLRGADRRVPGRAGRTRRRASYVATALLALTACEFGAARDADPRSLPTTAMTDAPDESTARAGSLRIALNRHLREVAATSTTPLALAEVGAGAIVMLTRPVDVYYHDPAQPALDFAVPAARFVAVDQAAGWVYGLTINPRTVAPLPEAMAVARDLERRLKATAWRRAAGVPAAAVDDAAARAWAAGTDEELTVGQYTAGTAELRLTLERTGEPSPSERLRGQTVEAYFVTVQAIDMSREDAYQRLILDRARAQGVPVETLRLGAFLQHPARP